MPDETQQIMCATCHKPLEGPSEPNPQDRFACPLCGEGDSLENVLAEVRGYAEEHAMQGLSGRLREISDADSSIDFAPSIPPKRRHRFIVDLKTS